MKKSILFISLTVMLFLVKTGISQTAGTLTFTFTQPQPGTATKNVIAVWIENGSGTFIKTKFRYWGSGSNDHLPTWVTKSAQNVTDASTGATRTATTTPTAWGTKTFTWDAKNVNGAVNGSVVTDGVYKIWIESAYSPYQDNPNGNHNMITSYSFNKTSAAEYLTPANTTLITGVIIDWVPVSSAVAPVASFSAANTTICQNNSVTFTDQSTNIPTSWAWNFGDGQTSTSQNPSHTFATAGTYTVALTATNTGGSNTSTMTNYITVNASVVPAVSISSSAATVCPGTSVLLTANPTNGGTPSYSWTVDGSVVGTADTYSAVFTNGQAVVCTMTSNAACASTTNATSATFNTGVYTVAPVTITEITGNLNSSATSGNQWFEQSTGIIVSATGASYTPTATGNYYSIVTDANGCNATSNVLNFIYTDVIENSLNYPIRVYPNPSIGMVNISFQNSVNGLLKIEDYTGKVVYNEKINQKNGSAITIDMSDFSNGIYFINLDNQKYKIILNK